MNPRFVAFQILFEVFANAQFSNKLLNQLKQKQKLSEADLGFVFKLVYGTIQYKIYLEYVVNKIINPKKTDFKIQIVLWMSLYQAKFLHTPDYSVAFEMVELTKRINQQASGFVNVKIKELLNHSLWEVVIKNNQNVLPLSQGFPFWLFQQIKTDFGVEIANKVVASVNNQTKISFRINLNKISEVEFLKKYENLYKIKRSKIAKHGFITSSKFLKSDAFKNGLIFIQDETSILATEILNPQPLSKIIDFCCAPGGKLTHIAQLVGAETLVIGNEIETNKKNIIEENLSLTGCQNVKLQFGPGELLTGSFDYIMLDAPCSGWGVLKRKPEIRFKKRTDLEMQKLYEIQRKLLKNALKLLKSNGRLVYATCTINKQENQNLIKSFLTKNHDLNLEFEQQFFGFEGNNNGFYIACVQKTNEHIK